MPAIVSRSLLLHSVLAYESEEIRILDEIIRMPTRSQAPSPSLPRELLLLIRSWLLPGIIEQLMQESSAAMTIYQQSLRDLLCADCIAYNVDIYGSDVWQWDQFSGPCACSNQTRRIPTFHQRFKHHEANTPPQPNPKQYIDAYHWLENYLSNKAHGLQLALNTRGGRPSSSDSLSIGAPPTSLSTVKLDIWGMVHEVLRGYECEAVREPNHGTAASTRCSRTRQIHSKRAVIRIVPLPRAMAKEVTGVPNRSSTGTDCSEEERWREDTLIRRVCRDLGLRMEYHDTFECTYLVDRTPASSSYTLSRRQSDNHTPFFLPWLNTTHLRQLLHLAASLAAACLSLPITLATVALTIICFYSRPKSFRLL